MRSGEIDSCPFCCDRICGDEGKQSSRNQDFGYLAVVSLTQEIIHNAWSVLEDILPRYRTDRGYQPFDLIKQLERYHPFHKVGEHQTAPMPFVQFIDEYIESYHARAPFSRERMGSVRAAA